MDEVVAAVQFRDYILIFTKRGDVYKCYEDDYSKELKFYIIHHMFPER